MLFTHASFSYDPFVHSKNGEINEQEIEQPQTPEHGALRYTLQAKDQESDHAVGTSAPR
jgi:hypothetical protein